MLQEFTAAQQVTKLPAFIQSEDPELDAGPHPEPDVSSAGLHTRFAKIYLCHLPIYA
jgi:hypothetical protein